MVPIAEKMTLKMRDCRCVNEEEVVDDDVVNVNVRPVLVDAAFDKIEDFQMGGGHTRGEAG